MAAVTGRFAQDEDPHCGHARSTDAKRDLLILKETY